MGTNDCSFSQLPLELVIKILSIIRPRNLFRLRRVSSGFKEAVESTVALQLKLANSGDRSLQAPLPVSPNSVWSPLKPNACVATNFSCGGLLYPTLVIVFRPVILNHLEMKRSNLFTQGTKGYKLICVGYERGSGNFIFQPSTTKKPMIANQESPPIWIVVHTETRSSYMSSETVASVSIDGCTLPQITEVKVSKGVSLQVELIQEDFELKFVRIHPSDLFAIREE
ncbi:hypothetical protein BCR33DRAFT_711324 [Rhizoclosmatium globosum]|uniref:F-box domain-containing protein n=1 Tax=Rhizoclosmatium globosum TaxID=329046 RepID=A0A1Y2D0W0_9FUNG|nr:hypothetical protein BCR33DRAFT_711324 [Rhizoclosmatium globosum]|eukprot:ORY52912.1 hypothetical protein BCR33DRAFT_711324 [Rhizoclosmatium globosum]